MTTFYTLRRTETSRQEIKKSRFIATAAPVSSETEAKEFIADSSDLTASHNCWAWRVGQLYRFSDDGEPGGTAGKPILQAIDGQSLDGVAVVVTRWFGGVLLGSGGLIRAYGGTAAVCLHGADKTPLIPVTRGTISCNFADLSLVQSRLTALSSVEVLSQTFTNSGGTMELAVHRGEMGHVERLVLDLTSGRTVLDWAD